MEVCHLIIVKSNSSKMKAHYARPNSHRQVMFPDILILCHKFAPAVWIVLFLESRYPIYYPKYL